MVQLPVLLAAFCVHLAADPAHRRQWYRPARLMISAYAYKVIGQ